MSMTFTQTDEFSFSHLSDYEIKVAIHYAPEDREQEIQALYEELLRRRGDIK